MRYEKTIYLICMFFLICMFHLDPKTVPMFVFAYLYYSRLPITRTLGNLNLMLTGFPSYIYCNFTLGNSNPR